MAEVTIYTTSYCPYCVQAKRLLAHKGIHYAEIDVTEDVDLRQKMVDQSGRRTVPQIFIDGQPIGGFDELHELDSSGRLDEMVGGSGLPPA
jgi:glutaredoxin 3